MLRLEREITSKFAHLSLKEKRGPGQELSLCPQTNQKSQEDQMHYDWARQWSGGKQEARAKSSMGKNNMLHTGIREKNPSAEVTASYSWLSCASGGGSILTPFHRPRHQRPPGAGQVRRPSRGCAHPFWSPGESRLPRSAAQSPGGVFNLKGALTLFTQNNTNMQRSSKSIVVKQRGGRAALAACPPGARLAPAARRHRCPAAAAGSRALCAVPFLPLRLTLYILVKYI